MASNCYWSTTDRFFVFFVNVLLPPFPLQIDIKQRFCPKHHDGGRRETVDHRVGHPYASTTTERRHSDPYGRRHYPMDRISIHSDPDGGPHPSAGRSRHNIHLCIVVQVSFLVFFSTDRPVVEETPTKQRHNRRITLRVVDTLNAGVIRYWIKYKN